MSDENPPNSRRNARGRTEPVQVLSYRHGETRMNNPEVGMVHAATDPDGDKTTWAYDPHLDPALNFDSARAGIETLIDDALASNDPGRMKEALEELKRLQQPYLTWTGKAETTSFTVDTVSLHVHERVDPATILAHVAKRLSGKDAASQWQQPDLFAAPFENLPLRQALEFYRHEKGWSNRLVAGDSLLVMNSLLTKESMGGCVQMIYMDPPYGIKYGSNFQPFVNKRDVKDRSDKDLTQEPETIKAFRDTWELGIHSYLTYLRDRLLLARELLSESGSIFVQIGDENVHRVRMLMDEVFGEENFVSLLSYRSSVPLGATYVPGIMTYVLMYAKARDRMKFKSLFSERDPEEEIRYAFTERSDGHYARMTVSQRKEVDHVAKTSRLFVAENLNSAGRTESCVFSFDFEGSEYVPTQGKSWKTNLDGMKRLTLAGRILSPAGNLNYKLYLDDYPVRELTDVWMDTQGASDKTYVVQTSNKVIQRCLLMTTDPGDLVLDPTCGSGTTAYVAEQWGRRWITCDTSRVAITLAKQRLMTASFDYYILRDPHEGLKGSFNYETVPHITLKSIANNPDIDTIYDEDHPKIAAALVDLNAALTAAPPGPLEPSQGVRKGEPVRFEDGETLHEWEVPFAWPEDWPAAARSAFDAFHKARQAMQRRMDQSIADHAQQETLYDKPHVDKTRLRITGPFSVEAVPAPTVLSLDESLPPQEADATIARSGETARQALWRDELLETGVRAKNGAVLRFAELETLPSTKTIHASGSLQSCEPVVVSFGPAHAALEQRQVETAMQEAYTLLPRPQFVLFCAFAFGPEAAKDIDEMSVPDMVFLKVQMNTDLLTEDLKKKRASNQSFWLMGQPDVKLRQRDDGLWQVKVNGFDYFDPRAGDLVSGGKNKIAMWSLDTDYDQRSLMPHQVFFPMAGDRDGWHRLRKTIRAQLDEDLLEQFHSTVSLPFAAGENRRIAVKIVDDRGIESLRIMSLED